jgi:hypothetical protein
MSDDRWVRISAEQAEWLRIAASRLAFDEGVLASTAALVEIADAYDRAPRTLLGAGLRTLGRREPAVPAELAPGARDTLPQPTRTTRQGSDEDLTGTPS